MNSVLFVAPYIRGRKKLSYLALKQLNAGCPAPAQMHTQRADAVLKLPIDLFLLHVTLFPLSTGLWSTN